MPMARYKLEIENDGNLGIYCSQPDLWIGNILEPTSSNPVLVLEMPVGIIGVRKILALFDKWKLADHPHNLKGRPSPRRAKCRFGTLKWKRAFRAGWK
jgi:hypothetical protein